MSLQELFPNLNIWQLYGYGCLAVGLPMAIFSVVIYLWDEDFDGHWSRYVLIPIRNFIHPGSFLFEDDVHSNDRFNYEGFITQFLDPYEDEIEPANVLMYIILSSVLWPIRLYFSVIATGLFIIGVILTIPCMLFCGICRLLCLPIVWLKRRKRPDRSE